jgi:threonine/homoserine/homoserine lactone efflux protein
LVRKFLQHVVPGIIKPIRILWNEVIGFVFLAFAAITIRQIVRAWQEDDMTRLVFASAFGLVMAGFGVSSFLRARKISRSS